MLGGEVKELAGQRAKPNNPGSRVRFCAFYLDIPSVWRMLA